MVVLLNTWVKVIPNWCPRAGQNDHNHWVGHFKVNSALGWGRKIVTLNSALGWGGSIVKLNSALGWGRKTKISCYVIIGIDPSVCLWVCYWSRPRLQTAQISPRAYRPLGLVGMSAVLVWTNPWQTLGFYSLIPPLPRKTETRLIKRSLTYEPHLFPT